MGNNEAVNMSLEGLKDEEVFERVNKGLRNDPIEAPTKTIKQIILEIFLLFLICCL